MLPTVNYVIIVVLIGVVVSVREYQKMVKMPNENNTKHDHRLSEEEWDFLAKLDDVFPKGDPHHRLVLEAATLFVIARHEGILSNETISENT